MKRNVLLICFVFIFIFTIFGVSLITLARSNEIATVDSSIVTEDTSPPSRLYEIAKINEAIVEDIIYDLPTPERQALLTTNGNIACDIVYVGNTFQEKYAKSREVACRTLERLWFFNCYSSCER